MRKPSIFSRDYERKMKKRRRRIAAISVVGILLIGILFMKIAAGNINTDRFKNKLQMWIAEDESLDNIDEDFDNLENNENKEVIEETPKEPESQIIEF